MARGHNIKLSRYELEIMDVLWRLEKASVREILESLPQKKRPAYTTVQTIVRRLETKGAVRRVKRIGNAQIFEAATSRQASHRRLIEEFLNIFGGSTRPLMAHLAETGKVSLAEVRELETLLTQHEKQKKAGSNDRGRS